MKTLIKTAIVLSPALLCWGAPLNLDTAFAAGVLVSVGSLFTLPLVLLLLTESPWKYTK